MSNIWVKIQKENSNILENMKDNGGTGAGKGFLLIF